MIKPEAEDTSAKIIADDLIIVAGTGRFVRLLSSGSQCAVVQADLTSSRLHVFENMQRAVLSRARIGWKPGAGH